MKIQEIKINDKAYPESLKKIKNPPKMLYFIGNIVGSRKCTEYGKKQGEQFSYNLAKEGINIISGLAIGIDTSAHIGALDVKGKTIAVLGNGPNVIFPYENKLIYDKILKLRWANC